MPAAGSTLGRELEQAWHKWSWRPALVYGDQVLRYQDIGRAALAVAAAYSRLGIRRGDRVVCQLPNCPEVIVAAAGAWLCGAIHVSADAGLTPREVSVLLERTEAAAIVCEPASPGPHADSPSASHGQIEVHVIAHQGREPGGTVMPFPELRVDPGSADALDAWEDTTNGGSSRPEDPALILPTSGTTGTPKLPIGYHDGLQAGWRWLAEQLELSPADVHLGHLPLSHGFGLSTAVMTLMTGGRVVLTREFSAQQALELVSRHAVTVLHGTPAHFTLLTERLDPNSHDVTTLRIGVGTASRFSPVLLRRIFDDLGMNLMLMYGSSEGVSVVTTDREEILAGCVGHPDPGWVSILAADGHALSRDEVGEIAFRRDMWPVRYWGADEPSADGGAREEEVRSTPSTGDVWYHTGDLGRIDDKGRLYVLGRLKQQIDRGGLKVDPGEVEDLLIHCPGIADAAVVGAPNPVLGEVVCACVVAKPGASVTLGDLRRELAADLAAVKLPEELCFVSELPRTSSGKVDRVRLREQIVGVPRDSVRAS